MTQNFIKLCTRINNVQIMSNLFQFLSKFIFLKNFLLVFLMQNLVHLYFQLPVLFTNFKPKLQLKDSKSYIPKISNNFIKTKLIKTQEINRFFQFKFPLKSVVSIFCQIVLVFGMTFGVLTSIPVHAQDGVIGFSDCKFGSAEEIRKNGTGGTAPGNETFRKCLQQILTFVFVLGVFLIGIRIALEAFKSLNPVISGNSINNSVKLGQDIVIGLILIGAPSIFLGLFNEAALQLPNLFELAQYRPGNEAGKTSTTGSGTTGTGGTGTTGGGGSGTTGMGGSGTGGAGATGTGLKVNGNEVSRKDLDEAIKARDDKKLLTDLQKKILEEFDKKPAATSGNTVWISNDLPKVSKDEVIKALAEAQESSGVGSNKLAQDGVKYAQGLSKSCLSSSKNNSSPDTAACDLIKNLQLTSSIYRMDYPAGQNFVLADGWSRTNFAPSGSATTGKKDQDITLKKGAQEILIKLRCNDVNSAQNSLLTKPNFQYNAGDNLNSAGCDATANFTKI